MKKLLLIIISITLFSCGTRRITITPEKLTILTPELNVVNKSEIGITLVSKEIGQNFKAIKIKSEFKAKPRNSVKTIKEGAIFINDTYTEKYDLFHYQSDKTFGIAISKNGTDILIYKVGIDGNGINFIRTKQNIEYTETVAPFIKEDYYKQEFIYNGRVGNALKFIYREYINDYARPAFTQDLQYDLAESKIIGFRGLRIEILNATNTKIEYKMLNNFNK